MVIYQTQIINIVYTAETQILQIEWKAKPSMAAFKEAYLKALQFVEEQQHTRFYCTDLTSCGPFDREQEAWLNTEYYPKVYKSIGSDIYAAVVFTEDHFKAIVSNYEPSQLSLNYSFILFNYFTVLHEAQDWLAQVQKGQETHLVPATS
ncbi:hypothetical protein [Pontibacter ruber]|uniref:STAS/SEC14 domain-containing protein n=1 Tax=Pontibacter ruber TaxID=1343895 RepID=A0ABW5CSY5_9BACT|nr:hypothetical protein [Pontibacter ruber]